MGATFFLFVDTTKIYQFKANDFKVKISLIARPKLLGLIARPLISGNAGYEKNLHPCSCKFIFLVNLI